MRRAPVVIAATVAGMAGVLGFHTKNATVTLAPSTGKTSTGGQATGSTTPGTAKQQTPKSATSTGRRAAGSTKPGTSTAGQSTAAAGTVRSAVGAVEQYGYGQLSVRVTVAGRKITNVAVANIQVAESYSANLAQQVIPMLRSEVLNAQSANVNGISGASYTVAAYAASVQSALDKLRV